MIANTNHKDDATKNHIFGQSEQHQRILKMIIQSLYNLGYQKSALQLEKQSEITYMKPQIKFMKTVLPEQKYEQLEKFWQQNKINVPLSIKNIITELKCLKFIRQNQIEKALSAIQEYDEKHSDDLHSHQKSKKISKTANVQDYRLLEKQKKYVNWEKIKTKLAEEIMIGDGVIAQEQLREMHDFIIQKSLEQEIEPRALDKILNKFMELQKLGMTSSLGFKLINNNNSQQFDISNLKIPPNKIIDKIRPTCNKKITFMKFCPNSCSSFFSKSSKQSVKYQFLLTVSGLKKQKNLAVWVISENFGLESYPNVKVRSLVELAIQIPEDIINVSWCNSLPQFIISTSSRVIIYRIFVTKSQDAELYQIQQLFSKNITQQPVSRNTRILCAQYNSLTNFIYIGSSSESILIYNQSLQSQILTIQPFFRTRIIKFIFLESVMLAVSATKPVFILYDLFKMQEMSKLNLQDFEESEHSQILSIRIEDRKGLSRGNEEKYWEKEERCVIVTSRKIYVVDLRCQENTQQENYFFVRYILDNPFTNENGLVEVQAMMFTDRFLITLGQDEFYAYLLPDNSTKQPQKLTQAIKLFRWSSKCAFTFDISEHIFISGDLELLLWGYDLRNTDQIKNGSPQKQSQEVQEIYQDFEKHISEAKDLIQNINIPSRPVRLLQMQPIPRMTAPVAVGVEISGNSDEQIQDQDEQDYSNDSQIQVEIIDSDNEDNEDQQDF